MKTLIAFFAWPDGAVWGNLLASLIWGAPAFFHLHKKINRHHRERMTQQAYHHQQIKNRLNRVIKEQ